MPWIPSEVPSPACPGLKITAGHRTMTGQKCLLTGHFFTSPVILTGHICMPSDGILNRQVKRRKEVSRVTTRKQCRRVVTESYRLKQDNALIRELAELEWRVCAALDLTLKVNMCLIYIQLTRITLWFLLRFCFWYLLIGNNYLGRRVVLG